MAVLCTFLERVWPEDRKQPVWRADSRLDLAYFLLRILLSGTLAFLTAVVGLSMPQHDSGGWISRQPIWLQVLGVLVLTDLATYWIHRWQHVWKPLWPIHAIHHSPEKIDWLVAARTHPAELILQKAGAAIPVYLLGFPPELFAAIMPAVATYSLLLHANLTWSYGPLGYLVASPAFHRWHHSRETEALDKNFSQVFSVFDFIFRTAYFPRGRTSQSYGLLRDDMPRNLVGQLLYPFRKRQPARPIVEAHQEAQA